MQRSLFILLMLTSQTLIAQTAQVDSLEKLVSETGVGQLKVDLMNQLTLEYLKYDLEKGLALNDKAISIADSINYPAGKFRALVNKGNSLWNVGLSDLALSFYLRALDIKVEANATGLAILNNNIGEVFKKKGSPGQSLQYYRNALEIVRTELPDRYPSILTYNIGEAYLLLGEIDSAEYYFEMGYDFSVKDQNERGKAYALYGMAEIERGKNQIKNAIEGHQNALVIRQSQNDNRGVIQSQLRLAECYSGIGEFSTAFYLLTSAKSISQSISANDLLLETHQLLAQYYETNNRLTDALNSLKEYQVLEDSLHEITFRNSLEITEQALQSEVRAAENRFLLEQQENQKRANQIQWAIIGIISIFLILSSIIILVYYQKSKLTRENNQKLKDLNKLISSKNQEIENINQNLDHQLRNTSKMLIESQEVTKLGSWEYNPQTKSMNWTKETWNQFTNVHENRPVAFSELHSKMDLSNYLSIKESVIQSIRKKRKEVQTLQVQNDQKQEKFLRISIVPEFNEGQLVRLYGSSLDITDQVKEEKKEEKVIEALLEQSKMAGLRSINLPDFMTQLLEQSIEILEVHRVGFWIYNNQDQTMYNYLTLDSRTREPEAGEVININDYPSYFENLLNYRTLASENVLEDERFSQFSQEYLKGHDIQSSIGAPIKFEGELIGILIFEKAISRKEWSYIDKAYAASLSDIVATAITNDQMKNLEIEKQALIEKLTKKNQDLEEFGYSISHHVRGPLSKILGFLNLFHDSTEDSLKNRTVEEIEKAALELDDTIEDIGKVLRVQESEPITFEVVEIKDLIEQVSSSFSEQLDSIGGTIDFEDLHRTSLKSNAYILKWILRELIENAIKFRRSNSDLKIRITSESNSDFLTLGIHDNGQGLDLSLVDNKIFKMYQRFHPELPGKGLGLYQIKIYLELIGGSIMIKSDTESGSSLYIRLSRNPTDFALTRSLS